MGLKRSIEREMGRIGAHPRYLLIMTLGLAFSYIFFLSLMKEGQPQRLPIGIVDEDCTYLSRRLAHEIDAMQGVDVVQIYDAHVDGRKAMQRREIYALIDIPAGTYNEVLSFRAPHIGLYANNAYLLAGTLSYKNLVTISNMAAGAVQREVLRKKGYDERAIMGLIQPIEIDAHMIGNPMANYRAYLLTTILPGILGLMCMLLTIYVIGVELKNGTGKEWIEAAGGNVGAAILGKVLPIGLWFFMLGLLGNFVMFGIMKFPMEGSWFRLTITMMLYLMAMQAAGVLFVGLMPELRTATCIGAFYGILAFSLSGFTFPVVGMPRIFQALSVMFPLRQHYLIYVNEALFGLPMTASWIHFGILILFWLLPLPVMHRIKKEALRSTQPLTTAEI